MGKGIIIVHAVGPLLNPKKRMSLDNVSERIRMPLTKAADSEIGWHEFYDRGVGYIAWFGLMIGETEDNIHAIRLSSKSEEAAVHAAFSMLSPTEQRFLGDNICDWVLAGDD